MTFTDTVRRHLHLRYRGNNPITAGFVYSNDFFVDVADRHYVLRRHDDHVESHLLPAGDDAYGFTAANGVTYLIHYNDVDVVFPVISGANVNAGSRRSAPTSSTSTSTRSPRSAGHRHPDQPRTPSRSTATSTRSPARRPEPTTRPARSSATAIAPMPFLSANTFSLTDPTVVYTLHLDANNLPTAGHRDLPGAAQPRPDHRQR